MAKKLWDLRSIQKVIATTSFELICTFDNEEVKSFDMKPLLKKTGSMVLPLRRLPYFKKVFIEMGVPTWPNGFDLCADVLYAKGIELTHISRPKKTKTRRHLA